MLLRSGPRAGQGAGSVGSSSAAENTHTCATTQADGAAARLRHAVRNAVAAYARTGRMVDAALEYAKVSVPVFPLDPVSKRPIPRRDPDPSGQYPDGIPGTGGVYKATTDPLQIRAWWRKTPKALIGLPMGPRTGVWCVDVDTPEDHDDGVGEWSKLADAHEPIVTREHRSATGGPHLFFLWDPDLPIYCGKGALPEGISVKGQGGYVAAPPSVRKGRAYTVHNDIDPIPALTWLTDLILEGRSRQWDSTSFQPDEDVDLDELGDALQAIPNEDFDWDEWSSIALALFAASGGSDEGFALFDAWSATSDKYNASYTRQRWQEIKGSPPDRTGAGKIFALAYTKHGWRRRKQLRYTTRLPVEPWQSDEIDVEAARREVRWRVRTFFQDIALNALNKDDPFLKLAEETLGRWRPVWALRVPTGVGKTKITINELAYWLLSIFAFGPVIYCVPRHKLSVRIEEQFAELGMRARIFYGRDYPDPDQHDPKKSADEQIRMCLNLDAVNLATLAHADVTKTCCKNGKQRCVFADSCGYMRQQVDREDVQVWIVASDMLFYAHKAFGKPAAVIVDEAFWDRGLRVGSDEDVVPLASLVRDEPIDPDAATAERDYLRTMLGNVLRQQDDNGAVTRQTLTTAVRIPALDYKHKIDHPRTKCPLTPSLCSRAISLEWKHMPPFKLKPGMTRAEFFNRYDRKDLIKEIRHCWNVIYVWKEVREALENADLTMSGRLALVQNNGLRAIAWSCVAEIKQQYQVPTLLLDATLPEPAVLQAYHPTVEIVADLKVALPECVQVRQVLDAPTSTSKLKNEDHLEELRRYIWQRWYETGRKSTLVITQLKAELKLKKLGLPHNVTVEHYNNISGLDDYKGVRLLILAGRTAPGPAEMESLAGILSGQQPVPCPSNKRNSFVWYPRVKRAIHLRGGYSVKTVCDQHPDAFTESVRYLVHEGELIQAYGRARAINRSDDLDIDLLVDSALPIVVDEVIVWKPPSSLLATASQGVMLTAPCDLVKLWPDLWSNKKAAYRTVSAGVPKLPPFVEVKYQLVGPKMKRRVAYFDPAVIPDPRAWLTSRLGPLLPL